MSLRSQIIYLARHATPDWTRKDIPYHLPPGPPLTERGQAEARLLGDFMRQAGVRQVYCSPLERCQHTAQIASEIANTALEVRPELMEVQPDEKAQDIFQRVWPIFETAAQHSSQGQPTVLVTHGGTVNILLSKLGLDEDARKSQYQFDHGNPLPPAGVWAAERQTPDHPWELRLAFIPEANG